MATNTPFLDLYKKDPIADKDDTFNITTMLNENWDKIDSKVKEVASRSKENKVIENLKTGKSYEYKHRISANGKPQILYKEVL